MGCFNQHPPSKNLKEEFDVMNLEADVELLGLMLMYPEAR